MRKNNNILNFCIVLILCVCYCASMGCMSYANSELTYQLPRQRYIWGAVEGVLFLLLFTAFGFLIFSLIYEWDDKPKTEIYNNKDMD